MKHILIIHFFLLLTSPLFGDSHKREILYMWETSSGVQWKVFGDKNTQPQYNGEVLIGKPNGLGVIIFPNGINYIGEWRYGKYEGQGTYTYGKGKWEGDKYKGKFRGGYRNGQGTYTWSDGDKYVGAFKSDKPNGQGTYIWSDGRKYEGLFKDGKKHGRGTLTSINGYKYLGEWRRDKPWNVKFYDRKGNIIGKFVNGGKIIEEPVVVVKKNPGVVVWKKPVVVVEKKPGVVVEKKPEVEVEEKPGVVVEKKHGITLPIIF